MLSSALVMLAVIKSGDMVDYLADWPDVVEDVIGNLRYWKAELRVWRCALRFFRRRAIRFALSEGSQASGDCMLTFG
jgi:hypothetical protein